MWMCSKYSQNALYILVQRVKNERKRKSENEKRWKKFNKFTKINFDVGAEQKSEENSIV